MSNQTQDKITLAQNLKDQCKFKEALETLSNIENVIELTVDEQISFFLLQSSLFYNLLQDNKALDAADWVYQKSIETGNDFVMLDASLARGKALMALRKNNECYNSISKCEELISKIKNQPEKIIGKRKVNLYCLKALYHLYRGEFDKSFEYIKPNLALSRKYGTKRDISKVFGIFGLYYSQTGDFTMALENCEKALKLSKEINDTFRIARICNNIGYILRQQGDLDRALEYLEQSVSLDEEMGNYNLIAFVLEEIGLILYEKGELTKALNYLKRSYQLSKEIGNYFFRIMFLRNSFNLFYTFHIYLDQNDLESAQTYLEELKNLSEKENIKRINDTYRIAKALILKKTGGTRNIIKAEEILKELLEEKSIENDLLVIILLNLCDLLYKELQITNEPEILEEIQPLITKLLEISEKMHSFLLLAEVNFFKAKYKLINFELVESQRLLTKAQQIAQKNTLSRLEKKISMEHDQLLEKLDIWKELKERNTPISERLKLISFEGDLNLMMRKKEIEQVKILPEEPQLLSIITEGGLSLYIHFFSKKWKNTQMFGSFMTAFNMFSHEFFSRTLNRVKIGENTIIMEPFEDKFLCYVIKGQTYPAQQKLNKFSEGIKNSKEILDSIDLSFSTGAIIKEENTPDLGKLVSTIFV